LNLQAPASVPAHIQPAGHRDADTARQERTLAVICKPAIAAPEYVVTQNATAMIDRRTCANNARLDQARRIARSCATTVRS